LHAKSMQVFRKAWHFIFRIPHILRKILLKNAENVFGALQSLPFYRSCMRRVVSDTKATSYAELPDKAAAYLKKHYKDLDWFRSNDEKTFFFIAIKDRYAGFARLARYRDKPEYGTGVWLMDCALRSAFRGGGGGEKLIKRVIEYTRETGSDELSLFVFKDNPRAINFYKKQGFVEVEIPELNGKILNGYKRPYIFMKIGFVVEKRFASLIDKKSGKC